MGGEADDQIVSHAYAAPHAGRLLVPRQAPRVGHEGRGVAGKEAHDDAARAGVGEGVYALEPQRFREGERRLLARGAIGGVLRHLLFVCARGRGKGRAHTFLG